MRRKSPPAYMSSEDIIVSVSLLGPKNTASTKITNWAKAVLEIYIARASRSHPSCISIT